MQRSKRQRLAITCSAPSKLKLNQLVQHKMVEHAMLDAAECGSNLIRWHAGLRANEEVVVLRDTHSAERASADMSPKQQTTTKMTPRIACPSTEISKEKACLEDCKSCGTRRELLGIEPGLAVWTPDGLREQRGTSNRSPSWPATIACSRPPPAPPPRIR